MTSHSALVTGGTGFIASHLIPALVAAGWTVRTCGRRDRPADLPPEVDYRQADLAHGEDLEDLYDGVTHLFHLAGASSTGSTEEQMHLSNVVGTENLLAAAPEGLQRVLHMSSTSVYGEEVQLPLPVREDVDPQPSRGYGKAKWRGEQVVWRHSREGLPVTVVRPVSVYGPGNIKLLGSAILDVAVERFGGLDRVALPSRPVEQRLLHVDDLVDACLHLADHEKALHRAFNVCSPSYPSSHEVARVLAEQMALGVEMSDDPECGPDYDQRRAWWEAMVARGMRDAIVLTKERFRLMRKVNRNNRLSVDALLETGFEFRRADLVQGVAGTIAWYREHRWIL